MGPGTRDVYRWDPGTQDSKMPGWDSDPGRPKWDPGPQNIQVGPVIRDPQSETRNPGPQNIQMKSRTSNFL